VSGAISRLFWVPPLAVFSPLSSDALLPTQIETTTEASDPVPEPVQAKQTVQGEEADEPQPSPAGPDGVSKDEEAHDKDDAAVGNKRPNNGLGETASSTEKLKKSKSTAGSDEKNEEAQAENVGGNF